jgi:hypothetical protein
MSFSSRDQGAARRALDLRPAAHAPAAPHGVPIKGPALDGVGRVQCLMVLAWLSEPSSATIAKRGINPQTDE